MAGEERMTDKALEEITAWDTIEYPPLGNGLGFEKDAHHAKVQAVVDRHHLLAEIKRLQVQEKNSLLMENPQDALVRNMILKEEIRRWRVKAEKLRALFYAANKKKRESDIRCDKWRYEVNAADMTGMVYHDALEWYEGPAWCVDGTGRRPIDADRGSRAAKALREET